MMAHFFIIQLMRRWVQAYFTSKFFLPDKNFIPTDSAYPFSHEDIGFPSKNGGTLHGIFLKAKPPVLGTVVHCHGNAGNVHCHAPLVQFIAESGCNVLAFDYGGYGRSTGQPCPESIIDDARAGVEYCRSRPDVDKNKIALFGQSLGGAAAAGAMAREPGIRCLILEGTFTTYRAMAKETLLGKLLFPITPFVIPDCGPLCDLEKIDGRRVLIIHGEADEVVPLKFSLQLHHRFSSSTKLLTLKNFGHLGGDGAEPTYQWEVMDFLRRHLSATPRSDFSGH